MMKLRPEGAESSQPRVHALGCLRLAARCGLQGQKRYTIELLLLLSDICRGT